MTNEQEITTLIEAWAAAVRARDIDGVMAAHADDLLMFDVVGPLSLHGAADYRASWVDQFFPWHGGSGRFDLENVAVTASGDVAFATALIRCAGTEDAKRVAFAVRLTIGLKTVAGHWLITHKHHSEPQPFDRQKLMQRSRRKDHEPLHRHLRRSHSQGARG